ncbi:hypothetical protein J4E80_010183 [Alternaria sp. BMP 0032]|nr:hypothetical protein J4E80_010183 [Alternaria sp. BMP 0032]
MAPSRLLHHLLEEVANAASNAGDTTANRPFFTFHWGNLTNASLSSPDTHTTLTVVQPRTMVYFSLLAETFSASEPSIFAREDDKDDAELYPEERQNASFFNYYFLLGMLAGLILVAAWLIHRRNVRRRALRCLNGQQASARDVEAWPGTRRLLHGRYGATNSVLLRPTEGLDEHGEAPPPYQPKSEVSSTTIAIPLRVLSANESERSLPPQYEALP